MAAPRTCTDRGHCSVWELREGNDRQGRDCSPRGAYWMLDAVKCSSGEKPFFTSGAESQPNVLRGPGPRAPTSAHRALGLCMSCTSVVRCPSSSLELALPPHTDGFLPFLSSPFPPPPLRPNTSVLAPTYTQVFWNHRVGRNRTAAITVPGVSAPL
ncbi:hypothetical protein TREES_T100021463 [Tupaia chinensis]|uniref:Uncharacterized protein n=1 Tax=Tupaia chinensis TaxID=246437 RepID=L9KHF5_TUPCH|nr:hypothetical protein TREES_T100021463 [Tupaia chinensis]